MQTDFSQKVPVALENLINWASSNPRSGRVGPWVGLLDFHFSVEIQRKAEKGTKILWLSSKILRDSLSFSEILSVHGDFVGVERKFWWESSFTVKRTRDRPIYSYSIKLPAELLWCCQRGRKRGRFLPKLLVLPKISVIISENFGFIRFTVHGRYLLPGTRHLESGKFRSAPKISVLYVFLQYMISPLKMK